MSPESQNSPRDTQKKSQSHNTSPRARMRHIVKRHSSDSPPVPVPSPSPPTVRDSETHKTLLKQQRQEVKLINFFIVIVVTMMTIVMVMIAMMMKMMMMVIIWLVPVRRLFRPSRSMHFGDVSETNGRETPRQSRSAHAWAFLKSSHGALSIYEKNPEISVVAKVEFPIGKKLFHLVVNPGTWRGARPWTWNWYKVRET